MVRTIAFVDLDRLENINRRLYIVLSINCSSTAHCFITAVNCERS